MPRTITTAVLAVTLLVLGACSPAGGTDAAATTVAPARADVALAQPAGAVPTTGTPSGITVSGVGRITGVPDTLRATVGVAARRASVQEALDAANATAEQVLAALDDAGVAEDDVQTTQFAVNPQYGEDGGITGYEVTNLVEATLRDLEAVGATLDAVVRAGGDDARVQGVEYRLEDNAALLAEARAAAVEDARSSAEQYAAAAGVELGGLTALSEVTAEQPMAQQFAADTAGGEATAAVPLAPGTQEVGVTVTATWSLG